MPEISEEKKNILIEISIAFVIAFVIFLLSSTSPYERLELLSLDARFNLRPQAEMNPDIATIDIDNTALEEEGRWQDWTRDKHARIIDIIRQGHGALLGCDIYFSEKSEKILRPADVMRAGTVEEVLAAFRDYDAELVDAARKAANVYLGAYFVLEGEQSESDQELPGLDYPGFRPDTLAFMLDKGLCIKAGRDDTHSLSRALSPRAFPIADLVEVSRGVGFAQIVKEADGLVRKYPTFITYELPATDPVQSYLFPSLGLAMACDYLSVPLKNLRLRPGEYLEIPSALMPGGERRDLRIPINEKGEMIINWVGDYEQSFKHFPYSSLLRLSVQDSLQRIKQFLSLQDASIFENPPDLIAKVRSAFPDVRDSITYAAYIYGAHRYEDLIEAKKAKELNPDIFKELFWQSPEDAPLFYENQKEVFENVRLNHAMLRLLSEKPDISKSEAARRVGMPEKAVEGAYETIHELLRNGGPAPSDKPLYFAEPVIVNGKTISLDDLKGRVFFYGLTAEGTHDLNPMPFSPRYPMVGSIANVFNTIVTGQFITPMGAFWRLPLFLAVGLFTGYMLSSRTTVRGSILTFLFLIAYLLLAYWLFAYKGVWIDVIGPAGVIVLSDVGIVWYKFNTAEKKRKFIKRAFEHYMNPAVVNEIAKNPAMLELGGKEMVLTAFFSDVADFTTISEQLKPPQIVELLNEYLTAMTDIVLKYDGLLDKYEGDLVMAVFGAPIHFSDHATKACYVALEMQAKLGLMREKWREEGRPELRARIGINSGPMVVGNMGSRTRFDYTIMGDAVNLASRLEGVNKQYSTDIMISEFTLELCRTDVIVREIDLIRVKGKKEPVGIYEVLARAGDGLPEDMKRVVEHYRRGLEAYRRRAWEDGIGEFRLALEIIPGDGPSLTYLKRCEEYLVSPPPDDWDGVYIMTTK